MPRMVQHKHWSFLFNIYLFSSVNSACPDMCCIRSHGDVCNDPPCTRITCTCVYLSSCISLIHREISLCSCQTMTQSRSSTAQRKIACLRATLWESLAREQEAEREKKNPAHVRLKLGRRKHIVQVQCTVSAESCVPRSLYWCFFFPWAEYGGW